MAFKEIFSIGQTAVADPLTGNKIGIGDIILGVEQNGDLRWYCYYGKGDGNRAGTIGWHPNSGNFIGNG